MSPHLQSKSASSKKSDSTLKRNSFINQAKCYINKLPDELLIFALAHLEPQELRIASQTCARWNRVIGDESCWKLALERYFGSIPTRRLAPTWKKEYLRRLRLIKSWKTVKHTVQFDSRMGKVSDFFVNYEEGRMLFGSMDQGLLLKSNPSTGKIEREQIFCTLENIPIRLSIMKIDKYRAFVGYLSGSVGLIKDIYTRNYALEMFNGFHNGPLTCLETNSSLDTAIVTGGADGKVKIWSCLSMRCMCTLLSSEDASPISALKFDSKSNVVAGTAGGNILIWDINILNLLNDQTVQSNAAISCRLIPAYTLVEDIRSPVSVDSILYDGTISSIISSCLAPAHKSLKQWNIQTGKQTLSFSEGSLANITTTFWDRPKRGPTDKNKSLFVSGDSSGNILIWELPDSNPESDLIREVSPIRKISSHKASITQILIDEWKIVSGATDGTITIVNLLTGKIIRSLAVFTKQYRNTGENSNAVTKIWCSHTHLAAIVNSTVKTWEFEAVNGMAKMKKYKPMRSRVNNHRNSNAMNNSLTAGGRRRGGPIDREIQLEIKSSFSDLQQEMRKEKKSQNLNSGGGLLDLSEDELLSYAMMLSEEEAHKNELRDLQSLQNLGSSSPSPLDYSNANFTLEQDEETDLYFEDDDDYRNYVRENRPSSRVLNFDVPVSHEPSSSTMLSSSLSSNASSAHTPTRTISFNSISNDSRLNHSTSPSSPVLVGSWSRNGSASAWLSNSPRLSASGRGNGSGGMNGVSVVQRPTAKDEEEELMYVLELSLYDN